MFMKDSFFVSSAIDYPSAPPHAGHMYEKICCDVFARWNRLQGKKVHFSTGLDCHGSKIARCAKETNKTPEEFVKTIEKFFLQLCKEYNISYDDFIETIEKRHKKVVVKMIKNLYKKGDIYKGKYSGYYCSDCETYFPKEELNGIYCPTHNKPTEFLEEEAYFFKMSKYQNKLIEHIKNNPNFIRPEKKKNEILNRLKKPLHDFCLTREKIAWGIPFPLDKKYIVSIWTDALINYLTTINYPNKKFKEFWPALHIIGTDIVWHHTVIWGTWLLASNIKLPEVLVHGFIISPTGEKMSKTQGNVVNPSELAKKYQIDSIRYYLIREIPFGEDGNFTEKKLIERHNNELANDLGNLLQRIIILVQKQKRIEPQKIDKNLFEKLDLEQIKKEMSNYELHNALSTIWKFINECNRYINENKPWEKEDTKPVLYNLLEAIRIISILLEPYMPETSKKIQKPLNIKEDINIKNCKPKRITYKPGQPEILFKKIEIKKMEEKKQYCSYEDFQKLDILTATIRDVKDHPNADKLYILELEPKRKIVAGIKEFYKKEELINKQIIFISNLEPKTIKGIESQGMLLAAGDKNKCILLCPDKKTEDNLKIK